MSSRAEASQEENVEAKSRKRRGAPRNSTHPPTSSEEAKRAPLKENCFVPGRHRFFRA